MYKKDNFFLVWIVMGNGKMANFASSTNYALIMNRIIILLAAGLMAFVSQAQTLDQCQQAAERNYPLIA